MKKAFITFITFMAISLYLMNGLKPPAYPIGTQVTVYLENNLFANGFTKDYTCTVKNCYHDIVYYTTTGKYTIEDYPETLLTKLGE